MATDRPEAAAQAPAVQDQVAAARSRVLGGRGPGAGPVEVLEHTRARDRVGGTPVPRLREQVAVEAAATRGDPEVLALQVATDRSRLAGSARTVARRIRADRPESANPSGIRRAAAVLALGAVLLRTLVRLLRD